MASCLSFSRLVSSSCFVLPYPYLLCSYRFRSRWRCRIGRGVGRFGFSSLRPVSSSRSAARSISPYRIAGGGGAPFLSAHSPASFVGGGDCFLFRLACSSRLLVSLAPSRGSVSWLFFAVCPCVSSCSSIHRRLVFSARPAARLAARLAARPRVPWWRFVLSVLLSFVLVSPSRSLRLMTVGTAAACLSHLVVSVSPCRPYHPIVRGRRQDGRCGVWRYGGGWGAVFVSSISFHQERAMAMTIWIMPQGRGTQFDDEGVWQMRAATMVMIGE